MQDEITWKRSVLINAIVLFANTGFVPCAKKATLAYLLTNISRSSTPPVSPYPLLIPLLDTNFRIAIIMPCHGVVPAGNIATTCTRKTQGLKSPSARPTLMGSVLLAQSAWGDISEEKFADSTWQDSVRRALGQAVKMVCIRNGRKSQTSCYFQRRRHCRRQLLYQWKSLQNPPMWVQKNTTLRPEGLSRLATEGRGLSSILIEIGLHRQCSFIPGGLV